METRKTRVVFTGGHPILNVKQEYLANAVKITEPPTVECAPWVSVLQSRIPGNGPLPL